MTHVVTLERTETFTITIEDADSEMHAIEVAKDMVRDDDDMGAQWSDSLEFTHEDAYEE